jgi:hypothetical protein
LDGGIVVGAGMVADIVFDIGLVDIGLVVEMIWFSGRVSDDDEELTDDIFIFDFDVMRCNDLCF